MELKEFSAQLAEMKTALEAKAKADVTLEVTEQLKAIAETKAASEGKTALEIKALSDDLAVTMKALDFMQKSMKKVQMPTMAAKNFESELGEMLSSKAAELKDFKTTKKGFGALELQSKVVGNLASATNLTGAYFVPPTLVPGVETKPYEQTHMRDLLPVGQTTSNLIRYVRDNGGQGGPAMVAEGGIKPQQDRALQVYDANVRKIATYFRVPEEMIDDIPYLQSFLAQIGIQEVMVVEDAQILYGDGTGQNLSGLFTNATAFAAGTSVIGASANNFDVLMAARKQGRVAKYNIGVALLSPIDYFDMIEKKDSTNNYLFLGGGNGIDLASNGFNFRGLQVIEHTAVAAGDFIVFDPMKAAIFDRMGTTVRFYDQDQDNAIKNLITIVIEKRLALPIYQPAAFIKGTFATAIADLTTL